MDDHPVGQLYTTLKDLLYGKEGQPQEPRMTFGTIPDPEGAPVERMLKSLGRWMGITPQVPDASSRPVIRSEVPWYVTGPTPGVTALAGLKYPEGFYSRVDRAALQLPKSLPANKVMEKLLNAPGGAAKEELVFRNVPEFLQAHGTGPVSREAVLQHLAANPLDLRRMEPTQQYAKYNYTLPGGTDYTETRFQAPQPNYHGQFYGKHYHSTPDILGWSRTTTRTLPGGAPGTFAEEFQSDLHQARTPGYPLQDAWQDLLMKQQLLDAANAGHEWVGMTRGSTQVERYGQTGKHAQGMRTNYDQTNVNKFNKLLKSVGGEPMAEGPVETDVPRHIGYDVSAWRERQTAGPVFTDIANPQPFRYGIYPRTVAPTRIPNVTNDTQLASVLPIPEESYLDYVNAANAVGDRITAQHIANLPPLAPKTSTEWIARLTPAMREKILKQGFPLLTLAGMAAPAAMATHTKKTPQK